MPGPPYSDANAEDLESSLSSQFSLWLGGLIGSVILTAVLWALGFGIPAKWTAVVAGISAVLLGLNMLHAKMLDMAQARAEAGIPPTEMFVARTKVTPFRQHKWNPVFGVGAAPKTDDVDQVRFAVRCGA